MIFTPDFAAGDLPLAEYPRPQFYRDSYLCLNGAWDYAARSTPALPDAYDGKITVPYPPEAPASGVSRVTGKGEYLIYRRAVTLPEGFFRGRLLLQFGAVDQCCRVLLNGRDVGGHEGGYTPFTVDLTDAWQEGENELCVIVTDDADSHVFGRGKQRYRHGGIWYTPVSGIWQTVWLESTPCAALTAVRLTPSATDKSLTVTPEATVRERVTLTVLDGERVLATATVTAGESVTIPLPECHLYTTARPELYRL